MTDPDSIVFVIDDDAQVRDSLVNLCRSVDLNATAFASTEEFLRHERPDAPSCLILDVRFPGFAPDGLEFQRELANSEDAIPVIFISGHGDIPMSVLAIKRGAVEFLTKPVRERELLDAIRQGIDQDRAQRIEAKALRTLNCRFESLTTREREILWLVARGLLNKQIAAALGLSEVTVKAHRGHVMRKMEAGSLADLVRMSDQLFRLHQSPDVALAVNV